MSGNLLFPRSYLPYYSVSWRKLMKELIGIILIAALIFSAPLQAEEKKIELTLKDSIVQALKENLDLQVQVTNPDLALQNKVIRGAIFIPKLELEAAALETNRLSGDALQGADVITSERLSLNLAISQRLAIGGDLRISLQNQRFESNSIYNTINPSLSSVLDIQLTQPLLKNFGTLATKKDIIIAANDYKKARHQLRQSIIDLVYNVEDAYWNLVYFYQDLESRKKSLQRSMDLLRQNEIKVRVGSAAPIDILEAKAEVATNESQVIQAEKAIQTAEENLKRILNMTQRDERIVPVDMPEVKPVQTDLNAFLEEALNNRPDIERARLDLKNNNVLVKYARNQMLPDLQLVARYYTTGVGGDQTIYDGNPLFGGQPIGFIQRDIWDTIKDTFSALYKNYNVSLRLTIPLSFAQEKAQMAQAKLNLKQALLSLKNTENIVYSEVKDVIKELEANSKLVESNQIALKLQGQKLKAEQKKLSVGLSTNYDVLNYQRDFAQTETGLLNSLKEYNMTVAKINRVLARTMKAYDIKLKDYIDKD